MEALEIWMESNQALAFYGIMVFSFILNRLPFIGVFFRSVNTLLHETGHAVGAILTSGEVLKIELNKDTSGIAQTKARSKTGAFITSFAGYPFAAFASSLLLILALNGQHKIVAFILLTIVSLNLMFFVRNMFGILWLLLFAGLTIVTVWYSNDLVLRIIMQFICMISFTETFFSTLLITFLAFTKPKSSGDMANLQKTTGVPAGFWALINVALVAWVLYYTVIHYFPNIQSLATL